MKAIKIFKLFVFAIVIVLSAFFTGCNDENRLTLKDSQDISEDALTDSYYEDADDMASIALQSDNATTGKIVAIGSRGIVISDARMACAGAVKTIVLADDSTLEIPKGTITIDFGTGCTDGRGNVRSGKLIINFTGRRFMPGSTAVISTGNYTINGLALEGMRILTNISGSTESAPKVSIVLKGGKATFPSGEIALREASVTREWIRASSPTEDELKVEGTATGTSRAGRDYTINIKETLVFKRNCGLPVSGVKVFTVEGKEIVINYGDGECDRSLTYTVGDRTVTTNVGNN